MDEKILLFRLNIPQKHLQENINISLDNTVRLLKSSDNENSYFILIEKDNGYRIEELTENTTVSFLLNKMKPPSKGVALHIWSPRDPDDKEQSGKYYYRDKENLINKIKEYWDSKRKVYGIICDSNNNPHYIGELAAYSLNAKEFLRKIFRYPELGELTSAFFFSNKIFFNIKNIQDYGVDIGSIKSTINEIENLCKDKEKLQYPLKYIEFDKDKFTNLLRLLKSLNSIQHQIDKLKGKREIVKNFLKGKFLENITQLVFEELLNYKVQATGYENWANILREDVIDKKNHGKLASQVRRLPDFYFSYKFDSIPPLCYNGYYIKTGWLEVKYRKKIRSEDINEWKNFYEPEIFLLIHQATNKQFYFLKVSDLSTELSSMEKYLFEKSLLSCYKKDILEIINEMIKIFEGND